MTPPHISKPGQFASSASLLCDIRQIFSSKSNYIITPSYLIMFWIKVLSQQIAPLTLLCKLSTSYLLTTTTDTAAAVCYNRCNQSFFAQFCITGRSSQLITTHSPGAIDPHCKSHYTTITRRKKGQIRFSVVINWRNSNSISHQLPKEITVITVSQRKLGRGWS